ncbi:protein kinase domain-containing protein [Ophiostoma piceae UAMH 11346]|uniref:Protein kinase domain-containing protein n=1 Tax=Ophiostoma piceae (strain UAMH 11346) TaxID=1262450 RepID=S3BS74_OPHP1|nr:protein kinase domain-containing protein [Ophiostoma piceae UAMH 11346]
MPFLTRTFGRLASSVTSLLGTKLPLAPLAFNATNFERIPAEKLLEDVADDGCRDRARMPLVILRKALRKTLKALDFLHTECSMINGDIRAGNVFYSSDQGVYEQMEAQELVRPTPRKEMSAAKADIAAKTSGGRLRRATHHPLHDAAADAKSPRMHRAPEVSLHMPWSYASDFWSVGSMAWCMLERYPLHRNKLPSGHSEPGRFDYQDIDYMGELSGAIGPPPYDFLKRSLSYDGFLKRFYTGNEPTWPEMPVAKDKRVDSHTLHDYPTREKVAEEQDFYPQPVEAETRAELAHESELFFQFLNKMLRWMPEEGSTAAELLKDEWLNRTSPACVEKFLEEDKRLVPMG